MTDERGFSLVELMIVVAIIGILAAIAVPNFMAMQLKSKRSELPANVGSIRVAELTFDATDNTYIAAPAHPRAVPDKNAVAWTLDSAEFESLGWRADSNVRGVYEVTMTTTTDFTVTGIIDCDGDGTVAMYSAGVHTNSALRAGDENAY
jgi:type IV pilus assembly protein PilA